MTVIEGDFVIPSIAFSEPKLYFKYTWEKGVAIVPIAKSMILTCASQLPVNF